MDWEVTIRMGSSIGSYTVTAPKYYEAKIKGLSLFLVEFRIPGRPYEFLTSKKNLVEVGVRALEDRRRGAKEAPRLNFYLDQVDTLGKLIRLSELNREAKTKSIGLLYDLREVLVGTASS